jgi:hypothetical protein
MIGPAVTGIAVRHVVSGAARSFHGHRKRAGLSHSGQRRGAVTRYDQAVHNKPQAHAADDHDHRGFSTLEQLHDDTRRLYLRLTNKNQPPATATKRPTPAARRKR